MIIMKKIWVYLLGILSGVILTFLVSLIINKSKNSDITYFDEPGEAITVECYGRMRPVTSFKIFQTLDKNAGLALGEDLYSRDLLVLVISDGGQSLFDNQTIVAPHGKCFKQIGIYKYKSNDKMHRTIPVVMLMDGEIEDFVEEPTIVEKTNSDYTFFDEPGEVMTDKSYRVDRVLDNGAAIAQGKKDNYDEDYWFGLKVLLIDDNANYYNNQIVKVTNGKCFRQVGIYKANFETLPIVKLMDN